MNLWDWNKTSKIQNKLEGGVCDHNGDILWPLVKTFDRGHRSEEWCDHSERLWSRPITLQSVSISITKLVHYPVYSDLIQIQLIFLSSLRANDTRGLVGFKFRSPFWRRLYSFEYYTILEMTIGEIVRDDKPAPLDQNVPFLDELYWSMSDTYRHLRLICLPGSRAPVCGSPLFMRFL